MTTLLQSAPQIIKGFKIVVIHLGTNDLGHKREWLQFLQYKDGAISLSHVKSNLKPVNGGRFLKDYRDLLLLIRSLDPAIIILCSSILPRPYDFHWRDTVRVEWNSIIRHLAGEVRAIYLSTSNPFLKKGSLKASLFKEDGLHLTQAGVDVLISYLGDKIPKALSGLIY